MAKKLLLTGDVNLMNVADPNVPFALSFPKIIPVANGPYKGHVVDCACMDAHGQASGQPQPPRPTRD
jgi:hypothetical protein